MGSQSEDTRSVEATAYSKIILGLKEVISNPTVGENGSANSCSQQTEEVVGEQTTLTKTEMRIKKRTNWK